MNEHGANIVYIRALRFNSRLICRMEDAHNFFSTHIRFVYALGFVQHQVDATRCDSLCLAVSIYYVFCHVDTWEMARRGRLETKVAQKEALGKSERQEM